MSKCRFNYYIHFQIKRSLLDRIFELGEILLMSSSIVGAVVCHDQVRSQIIQSSCRRGGAARLSKESALTRTTDSTPKNLSRLNAGPAWIG